MPAPCRFTTISYRRTQMNRIAIFVLAGILVTGAALANQSSQADFRLVHDKAGQKTDAALKAAEKDNNGKPGANNSIEYSGDARIVVRTGPEDDMMSFR